MSNQIENIDCSTIKIAKDYHDKLRLRKFKLIDSHFAGGYFNPVTKDMYIMGTPKSYFSDIIKIISHESLHKVLDITIDSETCCKLDHYLLCRNEYNRVDSSGICLDIIEGTKCKVKRCYICDSKMTLKMVDGLYRWFCSRCTKRELGDDYKDD